MNLPVRTTRAFLPCLNEHRATLHTYSHSAIVTLLTLEGPVTGLGHYFRCEETGDIRRWGFDAAFPKDN